MILLENVPLFYKVKLIIINDDLFIILIKFLFDIYLDERVCNFMKLLPKIIRGKCSS